MKIAKKFIKFNLFTNLLLLLLAGLIIIGSVNAEKELMNSEEVIRIIEVNTKNFVFDPQEIMVDPGEKVTFLVKNPSSAFHTFTIYHSRTDREEAIVNISISSGEEKTVTVSMPNEEKVLYLVCLPHEGIDMVGKVIVGDPEIEEES